MNGAIWIPCGITIVITAIGWIFTAGQTTGRIKDQELTLKDHHDTLKVHDGKLENLGNRMTASEAWRDGYNAGKGK